MLCGSVNLLVWKLNDLTNNRLNYVLLGSNIQPEKHIPQAVDILKKMVDVISVSNVWETSAVGSRGPNFLNCAVTIQTDLSKDRLKTEVFSKIENLLNRIRTEDKNAPRTIDVDPVIWDGVIEDQRLFKEPFLAFPLNDLIPEMIDPDTGMQLCEQVRKLKKERFYKNRTDIIIDI